MSISVNSFLFGSLLTSAKMTALQDSWIHVMSSFRLEHFMTDSTVAGSHTNAVVNNAHAQTITGSKTFSAPMQLSKTLNVSSSITIGGGSNTFSRVNFISGGVGTNNTWVGLDGLNNPKDALTLRTNDVGSETSADPVDPSWSFSINDGNSTKIKYKASSGNPYNTIFSVSTTGVVSAGHIPSAGRAFGGIAKTGDVTITASTNWKNVTGVTSGVLHCRNFTIDPQITITVSGVETDAIRIFAVGSITINGALVNNGLTRTPAGGFAGGNGSRGIAGGSGGGGGTDAVGPGGVGGATFLNSGGDGNGNPGVAASTFGVIEGYLDLSKRIESNLANTSNAQQGQGGEGGNGQGDGGHGGQGGGLIYLEAPLITFSNVSTLLAQGGAGSAAGGGVGNSGGGGGGGGGIIYLRYETLTDAGVTISTAGGAAGAKFGGGSNGGQGGAGATIKEIMI